MFQKLRHSDTYNQVKSCTKHGRPDRSQRELIVVLNYISSAECNWVVSDIFGKFEFLMKYQNMGLYAHFTLFLKVKILLVSEILRKNGVKSVVSAKEHVPVA